MSDEKEPILYRTSDIYFASYLCAIDVVLQTTERQQSDNHTKVIFVFKVARPDLDRMRAAFFGGHATVKVQRYVEALRNLKQMCYV